MAPALSIPRQVILSESEPRRSRPGTRPPGRRRESGAGVDGPIRRVRSQPEPHGATLRMTRRRMTRIMIILASWHPTSPETSCRPAAPTLPRPPSPTVTQAGLTVAAGTTAAGTGDSSRMIQITMIIIR